MTIAIQTKFLGPTNSRGSRIKATTLDKNPSTGRPDSLTIEWDHAHSPHNNHQNAAKALAARNGWTGFWAHGDALDGTMWVRVLDETNGFKIEG